MKRLEPKPKNDCVFTSEERAILANLHEAMAGAIKNKSKAQRAAIMQSISEGHNELMVRWLVCRLSGQVR